MTPSEFYGWAIPQLIDGGITVKLLNKTKAHNCKGWFSSDTKELVACMRHKDSFGVFIHEFCHFLQYRDDRELWDALADGSGNFFLWLEGKDFSKAQVTKYTAQAQELEHHCETKAINLIKKLNIDTDLDEYTQKANSYLYSYLVTKKLKLWPNTKFSIYDSSISSNFETSLAELDQLKLKNIPKNALELWYSKCYNSSTNK